MTLSQFGLFLSIDQNSEFIWRNSDFMSHNCEMQQDKTSQLPSASKMFPILWNGSVIIVDFYDL